MVAYSSSLLSEDDLTSTMVDTEMDKVVRVFANVKESEQTWESFEEALKRVSRLCERSPPHVLPTFAQNLRKLKDPIQLCLSSERTRLSGSACEVLGKLVEIMKDEFSPLVIVFFPALLRVCERANKVFVKRATATIRIIIQECHTGAVLPHLMTALSDRSKGLRTCCAEFLLLALRSNSPSTLEPYIDNLDNALLLGLKDGLQEVRTCATEAFAIYSQHFPVAAERLMGTIDDSNIRKRLERDMKKSQPDLTGGVCTATAAPRRPTSARKPFVEKQENAFVPPTSNHAAPSRTTSDHRQSRPNSSLDSWEATSLHIKKPTMALNAQLGLHPLTTTLLSSGSHPGSAENQHSHLSSSVSFNNATRQSSQNITAEARKASAAHASTSSSSRTSPKANSSLSSVFSSSLHVTSHPSLVSLSSTTHTPSTKTTSTIFSNDFLSALQESNHAFKRSMDGNPGPPPKNTSSLTDILASIPSHKPPRPPSTTTTSVTTHPKSSAEKDTSASSVPVDMLTKPLMSTDLKMKPPRRSLPSAHLPRSSQKSAEKESMMSDMSSAEKSTERPLKKRVSLSGVSRFDASTEKETVHGRMVTDKPTERLHRKRASLSGSGLPYLEKASEKANVVDNEKVSERPVRKRASLSGLASVDKVIPSTAVPTSQTTATKISATHIPSGRVANGTNARSATASTRNNGSNRTSFTAQERSRGAGPSALLPSGLPRSGKHLARPGTQTPPLSSKADKTELSHSTVSLASESVPSDVPSRSLTASTTTSARDSPVESDASGEHFEEAQEHADEDHSSLQTAVGSLDALVSPTSESPLDAVDGLEVPMAPISMSDTVAAPPLNTTAAAPAIPMAASSDESTLEDLCSKVQATPDFISKEQIFKQLESKLSACIAFPDAFAKAVNGILALPEMTMDASYMHSVVAVIKTLPETALSTVANACIPTIFKLTNERHSDIRCAAFDVLTYFHQRAPAVTFPLIKSALPKLTCPPSQRRIVEMMLEKRIGVSLRSAKD